MKKYKTLNKSKARHAIIKIQITYVYKTKQQYATSLTYNKNDNTIHNNTSMNCK